MERAVLVETPTGSLVEMGGEKGRGEGRPTRKGGAQTQSHRSGRKSKGTSCSESSAAKRRKPQEEGGDQEKAVKPGESSGQAKSPLPSPAVPDGAPQPCSEWSRCAACTHRCVVVWPWL